MILALVLCALAVQEGPEGAEDPGEEVQEPGLEHHFIKRERSAPIYVELALASPDPATPLLALYHESRSSRGEYRPLVPRLKALGYNCMSVDLSTGGLCREIKNRTVRKSTKGGRNPSYLDAVPEIQASLAWAREHHAHGKLIAWGSAFTASLLLQMAPEHRELIDGVIAFSPGEYFTTLGKSATWIQESARSVQCPVFLTSSRSEEAECEPIFAALASPAKTAFLPTGPGTHGSRALWPESAGSAEYWTALEGFLRQQFPPSTTPPPKDG